jgi:hypothetical protein
MPVFWLGVYCLAGEFRNPSDPFHPPRSHNAYSLGGSPIRTGIHTRLKTNPFLRLIFQPSFPLLHGIHKVAYCSANNVGSECGDLSVPNAMRRTFYIDRQQDQSRTVP